MRRVIYQNQEYLLVRELNGFYELHQVDDDSLLRLPLSTELQILPPVLKPIVPRAKSFALRTPQDWERLRAGRASILHSPGPSKKRGGTEVGSEGRVWEKKIDDNRGSRSKPARSSGAGAGKREAKAPKKSFVPAQLLPMFRQMTLDKQLAMCQQMGWELPQG